MAKKASTNGKATTKKASPFPPCLDFVEFDGEKGTLEFCFILKGKREYITVTDFEPALDQMAKAVRQARKALAE